MCQKPMARRALATTESFASHSLTPPILESILLVVVPVVHNDEGFAGICDTKQYEHLLSFF